MRYALLDRSHQATPRRFLTAAAAGMALLEIAMERWVVKRRQDVEKILMPEGRPLFPFGLYVAEKSVSLRLVGTHYSCFRATALPILLAAASGRAWPGTPAAHFHVIELTAAERRFAKQQQRA